MATNPTGLIATVPITGGIKPEKGADGVGVNTTPAPVVAPAAPIAAPAAPKSEFDFEDYMKTAAKYAPQAPTLASGGAASATAYTQELKDGEKTSSILNQLIDADSPYIQRAKAKAAEATNARGLMNSSIGVGAGVAAGIDAASPIAQSDASLYENTRNQNQAAQNSTSQFNAGQSNQVMMSDRANQAALAKSQMEQQYNVMNQGFQQKFDLTKLDKQQKLEMEKLATSFGYDIKKMDAQQVNELAKMATAQGFDITKMDVAARKTLEQMSAQEQIDLGKMARSQGYDIEKMSAAEVIDLRKQSILQGYDLNKMDKQSALTLRQMDAQQLNDIAKMAKAQGFDLEKMSAQQINDLAKAAVMQGYDLTKLDKQAQIALNMLDVSTIKDMEKMAKAQGYNIETMNVQQINDLAKAAVLQGYDLTKMDKQAALTLQQMDAQQVLDLKKMATAQGYNLETMSQQQINDLVKMTTANSFDLNKMAIAQGYTIETLQAATKEDLIKMATAQGYDLAKMATAQGFDIDKMDKQQLFDLAKLDKTFTQQEKEAQIKFGYDKNLIAMQQASAKEIALIDNKYKALIQASASATSLSNTVSGHIQDILTSDLDEEAKRKAIAQIQGNYENSLALVGSLAGDLDLQNFFGEILGLPTTPTAPTPPAPLTADQQTSINTFWAQNQNNPQAVIQAMTTYGVDAAGLAQSTGQTVQQVAAYLQAAGAPPGFGGVNYGANQSPPVQSTQTPPVTTQAGMINSDPTVVGGPATGTASPVGVNNVAPQQSYNQLVNNGQGYQMASNSPAAISQLYNVSGGAGSRNFAQEMMRFNLKAQDVASATGQPLATIIQQLQAAGAPATLWSTPQNIAPVSTGPSYDPAATPVVGGGLISRP